METLPSVVANSEDVGRLGKYLHIVRVVLRVSHLIEEDGLDVLESPSQFQLLEVYDYL